MKVSLRSQPAAHEAVVVARARLKRALAPVEDERREAVAAADERLRQSLATLDRPRREAAAREARTVHLGAGVLALAVLADSGLEHYRGSFHNKGMFAPLVSASLSLATNAAAACAVPPPRPLLDAIQGLAAMTGLVGLCFHAYNIGKRPGGFSWLNFFYAAPIGAPMALTLAGFFGRGGVRLADGRQTLLGMPAGRALAAAAAGAIAGTVGEAALLHFRGAYHNPVMFLPVTMPPVAAGLLGAAALAPRQAPRRITRGWLWATAGLGVAGVGFHAFGVWRNMGGFRNWSQNILNGPPLPAPPSFLGLAVIGLAALALMEANHE
ncbi:MAG: hypothetical protein JO288_04310 [Hyphomicrobiales bacterium]|nr:hypothetical protein [Hyphomicrobiales bacterium]